MPILIIRLHWGPFYDSSTSYLIGRFSSSKTSMPFLFSCHLFSEVFFLHLFGNMIWDDIKPRKRCITGCIKKQPLGGTGQSVQSLSRVRLFATLWTAAHQASLSITNSQSLVRLVSFELVTASNHLILCRPCLLRPSIFPSIRVFSNESALRVRWPKYWSFSFSISPSNEYSGLISFRMDWLDLLAVQVTLKSLPEHDSSKASIRQCSAFLLRS